MTTNKCVIYTRVSSDEQARAGFSIPFQRARCEEYAEHVSFEVVARFEEVHSAKEEGRAEFDKMCLFLESNPDVRTVIVHKHDRLARNLMDAGFIRDRLGVRILAAAEPTENSAAGRLHQNISFSMAAWYSDNLAQEVKKGLRQKFEAGGYMSKAPAGYRNIPRTRTEKARIIVDEAVAPLVRQMFEFYATGRYSLRSLSRKMFEAGLTTSKGTHFHSERVRKTLRDRFYLGITRYQGEFRPGIHPPIVSQALFDQVQQILERRKEDHGEKGSKFFLLRGILRCGSCNRRMTAEMHARGTYYRCANGRTVETCRAPYTSAKLIEGQVEALLPKLKLPDELRGAIMDSLSDLETERLACRKEEEASLRQRKALLAEKMHRVSKLLVDGTLTSENYLPVRDGIVRDQGAVDSRLAFLTSDVTVDVDHVKGILATAANLNDLFLACVSPIDRKELLCQVFRNIVVKDRLITRIEYQEPFSLIFRDPGDKGSEIDVKRALLEYIANERYGAAAMKPAPQAEHPAA